MSTPPPVIHTCTDRDAGLWTAAWQEAGFEARAIDSLDDHPITNWDSWRGSEALRADHRVLVRRGILRWEVLAATGGLFVDPDIFPRDITPANLASLSGVTFAGEIGKHLAVELSCRVVMCGPNNPLARRAQRMLRHSEEEYRGVPDRTGEGFVGRLVNHSGDRIRVLHPRRCDELWGPKE